MVVEHRSLLARVLVHMHCVVAATVLRSVTTAVIVAVRSRSDGLEGGRVRAPALRKSGASKSSVGQTREGPGKSRQGSWGGGVVGATRSVEFEYFVRPKKTLSDKSSSTCVR